MFHIHISPDAERLLNNIRKSNRKLFDNIIKSLDTIAINPYIAKSLVANLKEYHSYRIGDYRIIFEINKKKSIIYILKIAHRSDAYK
jgi:mRNA interferase RelE/StbE